MVAPFLEECRRGTVCVRLSADDASDNSKNILKHGLNPFLTASKATFYVD